MDEFTFKSDAFKSAIIFIVAVVLSSDFFTLIKVYQGELYFYHKSPLWHLAVPTGLMLKIAILVSTLSMKGALRLLLYTLGAMFLFVGLAHFFDVWVEGTNPASIESVYKLIWLVVGFVLVLPAGHAIEYAHDP